jgi:hypothetical protein
MPYQIEGAVIFVSIITRRSKFCASAGVVFPGTLWRRFVWIPRCNGRLGEQMVAVLGSEGEGK